MSARLSAFLKVISNSPCTGIEISIDEIGTEYSSLSYLKHLPIDRLKIDQSFVCNMDKDPNDRAIVKTIITLAHQLNLKAIAEGVETQDQLEILYSFDCDEIQGYLFSRPLPEDQAIDLLREKKCFGGIGKGWDRRRLGTS